jgi:YebC/PmpR family DNA-binding regulatory protein
MSGHSKWATIKRKKGAADIRRGQTFTKLARELEFAAREGGDPNFNFRLRLAIDKAKAENMPKDNIERAIKRGAGTGEGATQLEEITYEGYGPHGVGIVIQVVTDNRNRTVSEMRRALTRAGGSLGESGSVAWMFDNKGYITVPMRGLSQDNVFEAALEAGAEDVQFADETAEVYTMPTDLQAVRQAFQDAKLPMESAELSLVPKTYVALTPSETLQVMNLVETLEELDDVTKVYSNLEITDEALSAMEA